MKKIFCVGLLILAIGISIIGCEERKNQTEEPSPEENHSGENKVGVHDIKNKADEAISLINEKGKTVSGRFKVPKKYRRVQVEHSTFEEYLRTLSLKEHNSKVMFFDGNVKLNRNVYKAVVDMDIGDRNLQQCADAIMRLRGEFFYHKAQYDRIHFNFTNGFRVDYSKWIEGYRIAIENNDTWWVKRTEASNTYQDFRNYMDIIFTYAGTISLSAELDTINISEMQIGDVFIQGGSPGHAVIVVDMAENIETREKVFMLAQSYMLAQDIQILSNPNNCEISPWYELNFGKELITPEWKFNSIDLKRFVESN